MWLVLKNARHGLSSAHSGRFIHGQEKGKGQLAAKAFTRFFPVSMLSQMQDIERTANEWTQSPFPFPVGSLWELTL